jgi:hypothetical protein
MDAKGIKKLAVSNSGRDGAPRCPRRVQQHNRRRPRNGFACIARAWTPQRGVPTFVSRKLVKFAEAMAFPINIGTIGNPEPDRAGSPLTAAEQRESFCGAHGVTRPTKIENDPICPCHCDSL